MRLATCPADQSSCPCLTCSIKIVQVGIRHVVYSKSYYMDGEVHICSTYTGEIADWAIDSRNIRRSRRQAVAVQSRNALPRSLYGFPLTNTASRPRG